jgi:hypothetical protein
MLLASHLSKPFWEYQLHTNNYAWCIFEAHHTMANDCAMVSELAHQKKLLWGPAAAQHTSNS